MAFSVNVNGTSKMVPKDTSISKLLEQLEIAGGKVAVERNLEIVPKSLYAKTMLTDGDRVEIVHFIGGG